MDEVLPPHRQAASLRTAGLGVLLTPQAKTFNASVGDCARAVGSCLPRLLLRPRAVSQETERERVARTEGEGIHRHQDIGPVIKAIVTSDARHFDGLGGNSR